MTKAEAMARRKSNFRDYARVSRRDGQLPLEIWDALPADVAIRDERDAMNAPFVSISKSRRTTPIEWSRGDRIVEVTADADRGMATIWDYDLVIYCISQINAAIDRGESPSPRFRFHPHEAMRALGREVGKSDYKAFDAALMRLLSTQVLIRRPNDVHGTRAVRFNLLAEGHWETDAHDRLLWVEVQMPDFLFEAVRDRRSVLALDPGYFALTGGLERAVYRIARRMAGRQHFRLTFDDVRRRTGSSQEPKYFNRDLRKLIATTIDQGGLLGYRLAEAVGATGPVLDMINIDWEQTAVDKSVYKAEDKSVEK